MEPTSPDTTTAATEPPSDADGNGNLSHNHVDTEITPDVKGNHVVVHLCSCSFIWNCFTPFHI